MDGMRPPQAPKTIQVLRWIAVLPTAVAAYLGSQLISIIVNEMFEPRRSEWYLQLTNSGIGSYALTYLGAIVAPKFQFIVAVILATASAVLSIAICVLALVYQVKSVSWWWLALNVVVGIAASIAACWQIHENEVKEGAHA